MITVTQASPLDSYKLNITFNTGEVGVANLSELTHQGVFKKIKDIHIFKNFTVDNTVIWDDGFLDIAPEYLYFQAFKKEKKYQNLFKSWGYI